MRSTQRRRAWRVVAVLLMTAAALVAGTSSASAHAELEGSDPQSGEVRAVAPRQVTLTFGEPVERASNAIEVLDDHLRPVVTGPVAAVGGQGTQLSVSLPTGLAKGTYTVSWRASSTDTHPVSGSFRFSVGAPSVVTGQVSDTPRNDLAGLIVGGTRAVGYAGLALGPGLLLVVLGMWREGLSDRRTTRLLWMGLGLLVASTLGAMLFQGLWASGRPLSAIWTSPGSLDTHSRRFDRLYAVRFYEVVAFGIVLAALTFRPEKPSNAVGQGRASATAQRPEPATRSSWLMLLLAGSTCAILMATWALAGHASAGSWAALAIAVNLTHLMAVSTWLGGLALVAVALQPAARAGDLAAVLPRFSRLAFGCVAIIVLTGTFLAIREVGSVPALLSTEYGRLLLVKLAGVLALIVVGNLARRWVQRHLPSAPRRPGLLPAVANGIVPLQKMSFRPREYGRHELVRLHRGIVAELGIAGAVLALTAALVVVVPARQDYVAPFHRTVAAAALSVDLDLASPRVGDAVLHVTVHTADGRPAPVTALRGSMTAESGRLGPLALEPVSRGGASTTGETDLKVTLPARGVWTLHLSVQTATEGATALSARLTVS